MSLSAGRSAGRDGNSMLAMGGLLSTFNHVPLTAASAAASHLPT